jgi:hypothetical protein
MEITKYNSDTGNRDLARELIYKNDTPFIELLQKANELKACLIVKTSYINENKKGSWYIKGSNSHYTYDEIKLKIEDNVKNKKYTKRICYLIKYTN